MLRGIELLPRALDVPRDVAVLDGAGHDEVDLDAEEFAHVIQQVEVGDRLGVAIHGRELDEQVHIAFAGPVVTAQCRAEHVEARDAVTVTELGDRFTLVLQNPDHCDTSFDHATRPASPSHRSFLTDSRSFG